MFYCAVIHFIYQNPGIASWLTVYIKFDLLGVVIFFVWILFVNDIFACQYDPWRRVFHREIALRSGLKADIDLVNQIKVFYACQPGFQTEAYDFNYL